MFNHSGKLFKNHDTRAVDYLSQMAKLVNGSNNQKCWIADQYPNFPLIQIDPTNYLVVNLSKSIGSGQVGEVFRARQMIMNENKFLLPEEKPDSPFSAVKISSNFGTNEEIKTTYGDEADALFDIGYSSLNKPVSFSFIPNENDDTYLIPMRFFEGNSLEKIINDLKAKLNSDELSSPQKKSLMDAYKPIFIQIFHTLLQTMNKLNNVNRLHADICAKNIICEISTGGNIKLTQLTLIDFQMSKKYDENNQAILKTCKSNKSAEKYHSNYIDEINDDKALSVNGNNVLVHKNIDLYDIAITMNIMLNELKLKEYDEPLYNNLEKFILEIQETEPDKRDIDKISRNLILLAKENSLPLPSDIAIPIEEPKRESISYTSK